MSERKWEGMRWVVESYDTIDEAKEDDPNGWSWAYRWEESWGKPSEVFRKTSKGGSTGLPGCITTTEPVARLIAAAPELVEALEENTTALKSVRQAVLDYGGTKESQPQLNTLIERNEALLARVYGEKP